MIGTTRREFMYVVGGATFALNAPAWAGGDDTWNQGDLVHLLPTASHQRFLIKTSFKTPRHDAPLLAIDDRRVPGKRGDSQGYFWRFDVDGLNPATRYSLRLLDARGRGITDPWPLKTLPHPSQRMDRLRILTYTCAGGDERQAAPDGTPFYISLAARRQLLQRGLMFAPDVVIANGDHVYYDQRTMLMNKPPFVIQAQRALLDRVGTLDVTKPIFGTENEDIIRRVGDSQIAQLYGVMLRSTPVFFLTDDHDLFENDEATDDYVTLPPEPAYLDAARAIQHLYYPEFLPDATRPQDLPGGRQDGGAPGLSEAFGTLRYGTLFEALLYDTKRFASVDSAHGFLVPPDAEAWLQARTQARDTVHLAHIPSTPLGWSAGKWGEWYPDVLQENGRLGTTQPKPHWPESWWHQHQRILKMLGAQTGRTPLMLSGDLHQFSAGRILKSGDLDFTSNPIHSIIVGPLGTGAPAFPSAHRKVLAQPPTAITMDEHFPPLEKNGFTIMDVTPHRMGFAFYAWRPPQAVAEIAGLNPVYGFQI